MARLGHAPSHGRPAAGRPQPPGYDFASQSALRRLQCLVARAFWVLSAVSPTGPAAGPSAPSWAVHYDGAVHGRQGAPASTGADTVDTLQCMQRFWGV
eukprot:scaffold3490_cov347-Prasinococcus_capsulatus_cf.AAC.5